MMKKLFILAALSITIFTGCDFKPRSWWQEPGIAVMADSTDWAAVNGPLRLVFGRAIRTPQPESMYTLIHVKKSDFERYLRFKYIILAATLESEGFFGKLVNQMVADSTVRQRIQDDGGFVLTRVNQWARRQCLIILVAAHRSALEQLIETDREALFTFIDNDFRVFLEKDMFFRREQEDVSERLLRTCGWTIRIQKDFYVLREEPAEGFVWFRRLYPERWVFVRWMEDTQEELPSLEWVVEERNRIAREYYSGDVVDEDNYLYSRNATFRDRPAVLTTGLWKNDSLEIGGPFRNYSFLDKMAGRRYMIDMAVYAPGKDKLPYLRRLDVMTHTFRTLFETKDASD